MDQRRRRHDEAEERPQRPLDPLGHPEHRGARRSHQREPRPRDPAPRTGEEDVEDIRFLTTTQFDRLYAEFDPSARPLVTWVFGTGMRWSEATAQHVGDLDLTAGQYLDDGATWISVPTTRVIRSWKKGGRIGPPKSRSSRRTIVVPGEVTDAVAHLLDGHPSDTLIFRTQTGKQVTHSNFYNRVWKPATLRASVCPEHRSPGCRCFSSKPYLCKVHTEKGDQGHHVLPLPCRCPGTVPFRPRIHAARRHTHASWLIARGIRLDVIQDRLGHEDYLTTQRLYGHLMPDARADAGAAASLALAATAIGLPQIDALTARP